MQVVGLVVLIRLSYSEWLGLAAQDWLERVACFDWLSLVGFGGRAHLVLLGWLVPVV